MENIRYMGSHIGTRRDTRTRTDAARNSTEVKKGFFIFGLLFPALLCLGQAPVLLPVPEPEKVYGYELERGLMKGVGIYLSGVLDGVSETLIWHPDAFQAMHPNANPRYWNPYQSWRNKYRNGDPAQGPAFPGATTWLAWTTDGYHLTRTGSRFFLFGSITISIFEKRRAWWTYPAEFVAGGIVRSAGFYSTYSFLYSQ
jgi:hypothetical protein